jgi:Domain of unknown function (DUF5077)/Domain of unknown function (DUF3472)
MLKNIIAIFSILFLLGCGNNITPAAEAPNDIQTNFQKILFAGNAFVTTRDNNTAEKITEKGLENWTSTKAVISCYCKINTLGVLNLFLLVKDSRDNTEIKATVLGKSYSIKTQSDKTNYFICTSTIKDTGYIKVDVQGVKKTAEVFAVNPSLVVSGTALAIAPTYANDAENFYWSRRGPSCHLKYTIPKENIEYFYSEILVPKGEDKIGSYFMANGFADGYFGIQVNSATERRILFSVWEEDNKPKTILLRKGTNVTAGRFDGEGTGGQSYLVYNWKAGVTYKFLTKGVPDGAGNTIYTSWFQTPENNTWELIASFKRQNKSTYLTDFHSFLENFEDDNGYLGRKAFYSNQWVKLKDGAWQPINQCSFTVDATAKNKQRMDFNGGVENGKFFLQNGGFINSNVLPKTVFTLVNEGAAPVVGVE